MREINSLIELYGYPEICSQYGNVVRAMIDFKSLGYEPKVIVSKNETAERLTTAIEKLDPKLQKSEILQSYKRMQKK